MGSEISAKGVGPRGHSDRNQGLGLFEAALKRLIEAVLKGHDFSRAVDAPNEAGL